MKKMHYRVVVLTLVCVFFNTYVSSGQTFDSTLANNLQNAIDTVRLTYIVKGVSAAVIIPGQGTWVGASGVSHENVDITPGMKFCVTNCTQTFISMLMLKLEEMNVLNLDDSISKWLPNYNYVDHRITVRQLLNHSSGIFNFNSYPGYWDSIYADPSRIWHPEEILNSFLREPICAPGNCEFYSNTNYLLAGKVIEAATNTNLTTLLREYILTPLNYKSSFFNTAGSSRDTIAHEWLNDIDYSYIDRTSRYSAYWISKSMFSTAENMAKMYMDLFNGQIISQSSLNQMLTVNPNGIYGLGITKDSSLEEDIWYQDGTSQGYHSIACIVLNPNQKYSIAVLVNQAPSQAIQFAFKILQIVDEWLSNQSVDIESFSAIQVDKNVMLSWITTTEKNNQEFEIQRSNDGHDFVAIGSFKETATTSTQTVNNYIDKYLNDGKYYYRLKQIDSDGSYEFSKAIDVTINVPTVFSLEQNYPNPFNPSTTIKYSIPNKSYVTLKIYDILGKEIKTLVDEEKPAGTYESTWNAANLPSGVYFYQLKVDSYIETKKMILMK